MTPAQRYQAVLFCMALDTNDTTKNVDAPSLLKIRRCTLSCYNLALLFKEQILRRANLWLVELASCSACAMLAIHSDHSAKHNIIHNIIVIGKRNGLYIMAMQWPADKLQPTDSHSPLAQVTTQNSYLSWRLRTCATSVQGRGELSRCRTRSLGAPSQPSHDHGTTVGASHKHRRTRSWQAYGADASTYRQPPVSLCCILLCGE